MRELKKDGTRAFSDLYEAGFKAILDNVYGVMLLPNDLYLDFYILHLLRVYIP